MRISKSSPLISTDDTDRKELLTVGLAGASSIPCQLTSSISPPQLRVSFDGTCDWKSIDCREGGGARGGCLTADACDIPASLFER
jgi:hypothetical protein